jgi:thermitase
MAGFKESRFEKLGLEVLDTITIGNATYYRLYKDSDVLGALDALKKNSGVLFVEPEMMQYYCDVASDGDEGEEPGGPTGPIEFKTPDAYIADMTQWGAFKTKAYDAWTTIGFGANRPWVVGIDSGVQFSHEDLAPVVKHAFSWYGAGSNQTISSSNEVPNNANLVDYVGHATVRSTDYGADGGHGTHTAGTMAAAGNNGKGVAGMCWNADLISYKAGAGQGLPQWTTYGSLWHLARLKRTSNYTGTIPVNMSFGSSGASQFSIDMIEYALQNDIMCVAASGNHGTRVAHYPSNYQGVMAVGATNFLDRRAAFSSWGSHISVVAPGEEIWSTIAQTGYSGNLASEYIHSGWSGTSMAAPHVTGLIGYMLTFNPDLKPAQITACIEQNADYIQGQTGYSEETGWGRINVLKTIQAARAGNVPNTYALAPVKVTTPNAANYVRVYLYACNADGAVQNYVACSISGPSYVNYYAGEEPETEDGVVWFNMLRPGRYIAKAPVGTKVAVTDAFNVTPGQTAQLNLELSFGQEMLTIHTFPSTHIMETLNTDHQVFIDPVIYLLGAGGEVIDEWDYYLYDTLMTQLPEDGTYYVKIEDYNATEEPDRLTGGEYVLYVSKGGEWSDTNQWISDGHDSPVAPGVFNSPTGGVKGPQAKSMAEADAAGPIDMNTLYYACFTGPDYSNPAATDGAVGHYYKLVLAEEE